MRRDDFNSDLFMLGVALVGLLVSCALTPETQQRLRNAGSALQGGIKCNHDEQCSQGETCREGWCS